MRSGRTALPILLALGVLALPGCAAVLVPALGFSPNPPNGSIKVTPGRDGYLITGAPLFVGYRSWWELRVVDIRVPRVIFTGCVPSDTSTCVPIRVTENPSDEEFWQFEARVIVRSGFGIPYGRWSADYLIVGPERQCEDIRGSCLGTARQQSGVRAPITSSGWTHSSRHALASAFTHEDAVTPTPGRRR